MGWINEMDFSGKYVSTKNRKEYIDKLWNNDKKFQVLKSSMVGTTYYAAVAELDQQQEVKQVFATTALTSYEDREFSYKEMNEHAIPVCCDCPVGILKLLTPTDDQNANQWRKNCATYRRAKQLLKQAEKNGNMINACHHDLIFDKGCKKWLETDNQNYYVRRKDILDNNFIVIAQKMIIWDAYCIPFFVAEKAEK